jgi:protein-disulfide isomerase
MNGTYRAGSVPAQIPPQPAEMPTPLSQTLTSEQLESLLDDLPWQEGEAPAIAIIEYSDLQCPFCQRHHTQGTLDDVAALYNGEVGVVFQHFPLTFHPLARPAANAAECVKNQQGVIMFYDYIDELFISKDLSSNSLTSTAGILGASMEDMEECTSSRTYDSDVMEQMTRGQTLF